MEKVCRAFAIVLTSRASPIDIKGIVYSSCIRISIIYESETRPLLDNVGLKSRDADT